MAWQTSVVLKHYSEVSMIRVCARYKLLLLADCTVFCYKKLDTDNLGILCENYLPELYDFRQTQIFMFLCSLKYLCLQLLAGLRRWPKYLRKWQLEFCPELSRSLAISQAHWPTQKLARNFSTCCLEKLFLLRLKDLVCVYYINGICVNICLRLRKKNWPWTFTMECLQPICV